MRCTPEQEAFKEKRLALWESKDTEYGTVGRTQMFKMK